MTRERDKSHAQTGSPTNTRLLARETIFNVVCIALTVVHSMYSRVQCCLLVDHSSFARTVILRMYVVRNGSS